MAEGALTESETYLLKNWTAACRLEEAMKAVRFGRYAPIIDKTAQMLVDRLGKDEYESCVRPTQNWGDGLICFWMKKWEKSNDKGKSPWFCIGGLRLEILFSDRAPTKASPLPYASVNTGDMRQAGWDLGRLRDQIRAATSQMMKDFPKRSDEDESEPINYYLPEGRAGLRQLLLEDETGFTNLLISHGMRLAELATVITEVLASYK
ncbi:MAG: hypothetical protein NTW87_10675 [Planctomycetota bacterium]|nr:hypothetical protein [Planctomycetota bacterium]